MANPFHPATDLIDHGQGIYTIDAHYVAPRLAAIHLIVGEDARGRHAALFDTGTRLSWPYVEGTLTHLGLSPAQVRFVIPSHVHLDHAAGAGQLIERLPNAQLIVHPRGARHMIDPAKLFAATIAVYGEAKARQLYGDVTPIPAARVTEAVDGMVLALGRRLLTVLDTPGHARHHICLHDQQTGALFTGDMFGLSYRQFDVDGRASIIPTTTPTQFDPAAMKTSIRRLLDLKPPAMYLTHFGRISDIERLGADLLRLLDAHLTAAEAARSLPAGERHAFLRQRITTLFRAEASRQGWPIDQSALLDWLETDIDLNAQGLAHWIEEQESAAPV